MFPRRVAVALRGAKGAGKSAIARALSERLGWPLIVAGDVVRGWAQAASGSADAETVRRVADEARQTSHGVMGKVLLTIWPDNRLPLKLVIDSVRETADVICLRQMGYTVVILTVSASFETRLERINKRSRSDDLFSKDWLLAHDQWEQGLGTSFAQGDFNIDVKSGEIENLVPVILCELRRAGLVDVAN